MTAWLCSLHFRPPHSLTARALFAFCFIFNCRCIFVILQHVAQRAASQLIDFISFRVVIPPVAILSCLSSRPGLKAFLQHAAQRYDLYIFTAATADYAAPVIRGLDPTSTLFQVRARQLVKPTALHPPPFPTLKTPPIQSALQHSVLRMGPLALDMSWSRVLCGPC